MLGAEQPSPVRGEKEQGKGQEASAPRLDRTLSYAQAIVDGEIIAGPHVRNACRRHIDDLEKAGERGLHFDHEAADRIFGYYENVLKLSEGQFEGQPFALEPSQCFILGSLFGWKRVDGTRRFRRAYIEQGKGNGKSPMAGGIGLFGLASDGEAGAQIYAAASKTDQAQILFQDACKMVRAAPALSERLQFSGGVGREFNIAHLKSRSFFRPVSREAGKSGSGPRPHIVLADEIHEMPDGNILELLERGFKFRRQPLLLMITNSGSDRTTVCWEEHEHAIKVAAGSYDARDDDAAYEGLVIDDTTFSYVCGLDSERKAVYSFDICLRHGAESCTCNAPTTQIDLPSPQDFAALVIQGSEGQITSQRASGASITPSARLFLDAFATLATLAGEKKITRNGANSVGPSCENTQRATAPKNSQGKETGNIGSAKNSPIPLGRLIGRENVNTEYPANKPLKLNLIKAAAAESAEFRTAVYGWITATIAELFGASFATNAMLELVCSEIMPRLFEKHSNTCETRQRFRLEYNRLAEDLSADDPLTDPSCWVKANPLLGVTITEEYLQGVVDQAKAMPGKLNNILRLHFCQWTDAETAWMTRASLEPCIVDFEPLDEHTGKQVWLGADLSQVKDLTALGYCVRSGTVEDGEHAGKPIYDAWIQAWTPRDTIAARSLADQLPYDRWVREGYLEAPKGQSINYRHVAQALAEAQHDFNVQCLAYDRYAFSRMLEPEMRELGLDIECVEHPQGGTKKGKPTEAMKEAAKAAKREAEGLWMPMSVRQVEELILEGRLRIQRNPVTISAMMSAVTDEDRWGNYWLAKERASNKIDPAIALCMAVGAALAHEKPAKKAYQIVVI